MDSDERSMIMSWPSEMHLCFTSSSFCHSWPSNVCKCLLPGSLVQYFVVEHVHILYILLDWLSPSKGEHACLEQFAAEAQDSPTIAAAHTLRSTSPQQVIINNQLLTLLEHVEPLKRNHHSEIFFPTLLHPFEANPMG